METFVPQPHTAPEVGTSPVVPMTTPERHEKDRSLSELAVFLGITGDALIAVAVLSSCFWLHLRDSVFQAHGPTTSPLT